MFTINGIVSVIDMKGASVSHFTQITPVLMKKMVVASQVSELSIGFSNVLIHGRL